MTPEVETQLVKALALVEEGNNREALHLFEEMRRQNLTSFENAVILLNEAKCLTSIGKFETARDRLHTVQQIDDSGQFRVHLEAILIQIHFAAGEFSEGISLGNAFLSVYKETLNEPEYQDIGYDIRLRVACAFVSSGRFEMAIQALKQFLPKA